MSAVRTFMGVNIYPTTGRARVNGFRWEVLGAPNGPFSVLCETLEGARQAIREAMVTA